MSFGGSRSFTHAGKCSLSVSDHVLTVHVYQISWEIGGWNAKTPALIASAVALLLPLHAYFPLPLPAFLDFILHFQLSSSHFEHVYKLLMLSKSNVTALLAQFFFI